MEEEKYKSIEIKNKSGTFNFVSTCSDCNNSNTNSTYFNNYINKTSIIYKTLNLDYPTTVYEINEKYVLRVTKLEQYYYSYMKFIEKHIDYIKDNKYHKGLTIQHKLYQTDNGKKYINPIYDYGMVFHTDTNNRKWIDIYAILKKGQCNLREYIEKNENNLPVENVQNILIKILEAVNFVHSNDYVHLDLKPENILISDNGDDVKLIDFDVTTKIGGKLPRYGTYGYRDEDLYEKREDSTTASKNLDYYSIYKIINGVHDNRGICLGLINLIKESENKKKPWFSPLSFTLFSSVPPINKVAKMLQNPKKFKIEEAIKILNPEKISQVGGKKRSKTKKAKKSRKIRRKRSRKSRR